MKKEKIIISSILLVIMLFIQACGLSERVIYENERKQIYLSANANDIRNSGLFFPSVLEDYKNAGVKFITVSPKTVADFEALGKLSAITYSSLLINEDPVSKDILKVLEPYGLPEKTTVVISSSTSMTDYLRSNFMSKYGTDLVVEAQIDKNTSVFCFPRFEDKNFVVGYDMEELYLIKQAGLTPCIKYPAYSYENEAYPEFLSDFIEEYKPAFFILRENENENQVHLPDKLIEVLKNSDIHLTVFENENQISNEKPYIYNEMKDIFKHKTVRGFNMDKVVSHDETKFKYRYYQWYNSALERNTTFLNVNILNNPDTIIDDNLALTCTSVKVFIEKMEKLGYSFPDKGVELPYRYKLQTSSMCGAVIMLVLLYLYVSLLLGDKVKDLEVYFLLGCAILIIFSFVAYNYITKFYALLIMITVSSLITLILFKLQVLNLSTKKTLTLSFLTPALLLLTGIVSITALISDFDFFIGDKWFFGVKISLITPVLLTILNYYAVFIGSKEKLKEFSENLKEKIKTIPIYVTCILGVILLCGLAYYIIRTGKSDLIMPFEDKTRKFLTDIFIIRPRFKEFLIGYPTFILFTYFAFMRKNKLLADIFGIIQIILFTSILNTFCHTFTVLWVSTLRVINGLALGILISGIIIGILEIIVLIRKHKPFKFLKKFLKKA